LPKLSFSGSIYKSRFTTTAVYWNGGVMTELSIPSGTNSDAQGIVVVGSVVYVAGNLHSSTGTSAVFWKNGELTILSQSPSSATSIVISGTDVYITGQQNGFAGYWVNTSFVQLSSSTSTATGITFSGFNSYVSGVENSKPVYWENHTVVALPNNDYSPVSIAAVDDNVFITGSLGGYSWNSVSGVYWRDGVFNTLPMSDGTSDITSDGADVYISGNILKPRRSVAGYWKNGASVTLTDESSYAGAICVTNSNIFVAGSLNPPISGNSGVYSRNAVYWRNGVMTKLSEIESNATGIFVK